MFRIITHFPLPYQFSYSTLYHFPYFERNPRFDKNYLDCPLLFSFCLCVCDFFPRLIEIMPIMSIWFYFFFSFFFFLFEKKVKLIYNIM